MIVKRKDSAMMIVIYFIREYFIREEYRIAFTYSVSQLGFSVLLLILYKHILLYINQKDDKAYNQDE